MTHSLRSCLLLVAVLAVSAAACNKTSEAPDQAEAKAPDQAPTQAAPDTSASGDNAAAPAAAPARPAALDPGAVKALIERWQDAQNKGDFAAYEALYASRFDGVRRSGPRVVRLDRAGWMADRKRMFKRPMKVDISDMDINVFATSATVHFIQKWASGSYQDVGPKQLVVVREGDELRIAREEMLSSTLVEAGKGTDLASDDFAFAVEIGGAHYVVLDKFPATAKATRPTLVHSDHPDMITVLATVAAADIPAGVARWQGRKVRSGQCVATVGDIAALSRVVPHFSSRQIWSGTFPGEEGPAYDKARIAREAFDKHSAVLVGKLDSSACTVGSFVRSAERSPAITIKEQAPGALKDPAIQAFRQSKLYKNIQKEYESSDEGKAGDLWDQHRVSPSTDTEGPVVRVFRYPDKNLVLALVQAEAGAGCGQFGASLGILFKVDESGKRPRFELIHDGWGASPVDRAMDLDGRIVLLIRPNHGLDSALYALDGDLLRHLKVAYFDCDC